MLARHSILLSELARETDQNNPRLPALKFRRGASQTKRNQPFVLFNRKNMAQNPHGKIPKINILLIQLDLTLQHCTDCFQTRRTMQNPNNSIQRDWVTLLRGLAEIHFDLVMFCRRNFTGCQNFIWR